MLLRWLVLILLYAGVVAVTSQLGLSSENVSKRELSALQALYNHTNGDYWRWNTIPPGNSRWNFSQPNPNPCQQHWAGVKCLCPSPSDGLCQVQALNLTRLNLTGVLPDCFQLLPALVILSFEENRISGSLPSSLGLLANLQLLSVHRNLLQGSIPLTFANLINLVYLDLSLNSLRGPLDGKLLVWTNMTILRLENNLLSGSLPTQISNLLALKELYLTNNYFQYELPLSLTKLTNMEALFLDDNQFASTFPFQFSDKAFRYLEILSISKNLFVGSLPSNFGSSWTRLQELRMSDNRFTNHLPVGFGQNWKKLNMLDISHNFFSGSLPTSISLSTSLEELHSLYVGYNLFVGSFFPAAFANMPQLISVDLQFNAFSGNISSCLQNKQILSSFVVSGNQFTGTLPVAINLPRMRFLLGYSNYFTGGIPKSFPPTSNLVYISFSDNALSQQLPFWITTILSLQYLEFSNNILTGSIPDAFSNHSALGEIFLDYNYITGSLPTTASNLRRINEFYAQNNRLTGSVPQDLIAIQRLQIFYLQNNRLVGPLLPVNPLLVSNDAADFAQASVEPALFGSALINLDVSNNQLTGTIPVWLFSISPRMQAFVLSNNCFHGTIPDSICASKEMTSLALDGVSSACQTRFFPGIPYFTAFASSKQISGTIPPCLFSLPILASLHLSGNGLTGSLALNESTFGENLLDLSLSHNLLTGTIPQRIQQHSWASLDLSFNKFLGSLDDQFATVYPNQSLYLQINRLSGVLPSTILSSAARNLSVLEGNLFSCTVGNNLVRDLPKYDPERDIYSCGSETVNRSFYLCLAIIFFVAVVLVGWLQFVYLPSAANHNNEMGSSSNLSIHADNNNINSSRPSARLSMFSVGRESTFLIKPSFSMNESLKYWQAWMADIALWISLLQVTDKKFPNIKVFSKFLEQLRSLFSCLCVIALFVLMPVYALLSSSLSLGSYRHKYAWTLSAIFLSGYDAGVVLQFFWSLLLGCTLLLFYHHLKITSKTLPKTLSSFAKWSCGEFGLYSTFVAFNCIVMVAIDVGYVILALTSDQAVVIFIQISLSLFKVVWNEAVLWVCMPWIKRVSEGIIGKKPSDTLVSWKSWIAKYTYSNNEVALILSMTLLNNLILPCISIAVVSSDCYYNAFFADQPVASTTIYECEYVINSGPVERCINQVSVLEDTTYTPAFTYRYQCSAAIVTNFCPVYIYMFIVVGFVIPASKLMLKLWYDHLRLHIQSQGDSERRSDVHRWTYTISANATSSRNNSKATNAQSTSIEVEASENIVIGKSKQPLFRMRIILFLQYILPVNLQDNHFSSMDHSPTEGEDGNQNQVENFHALNVNRNDSRQDDLFHFRITKSLRETTAMFTSNVLNPAIDDVQLTVASNSREDASSLTAGVAKPAASTSAIFFSRSKFLVKINAYMAILLCYGMIFPPLAILISFAVFNITWYEHLVMGRLLAIAKLHLDSDNSTPLNGPDNFYLKFRRKLNEEVQDMFEDFFSKCWILIVFASFAFGFVIFDTIGDSEGWRDALPGTLIMICFPVLLFLCATVTLWFCRKYNLLGKEETQESHHTTDIENDNELKRSAARRSSLFEFIMPHRKSSKSQSHVGEGLEGNKLEQEMVTRTPLHAHTSDEIQ